MMNVKIEYDIRLNVIPRKGERITINTDLEELEEENLSTLLISYGYLTCWCDMDEYTVMNRKITCDEV